MAASARRSASPLRLPASRSSSSRAAPRLFLPSLPSPTQNVPPPPRSPLRSPFASLRGGSPSPGSPLALSTVAGSYFPSQAVQTPSARSVAQATLQPRCPTLRPLAHLETDFETMSPALLSAGAVVAEGESFPWDGGGVRSVGSTTLDSAMDGPAFIEHTIPTSPFVPMPRVQRASSSWSHHEHSTPSLSPSSPLSTSPRVALNPPTPPSASHAVHPQRLDRHQTLRLARQTIQVSTSVGAPPASYFEIDPDLTALESHSNWSSRRAGARASVAEGGLKPLTSVKRVEGGECPLRRIMGMATPPVQGA